MTTHPFSKKRSQLRKLLQFHRGTRNLKLLYPFLYPGFPKIFPDLFNRHDVFSPYPIPYNAPTQNAVDMYERKGADGNYYPITDPRSGYDAVKTTNPYSDRDPRFTNNILVPGEQWRCV